MSHQQRIDRHHPLLISILVDRSESMEEPLGGGETSKAQAVADQLNRLIYELVLRCVKSPREAPRPYFSIQVVGYSTDPHGTARLESLLPVPNHDPRGLATTTELAEHPLRVAQRRSAGGGMVSAPEWVDPAADGGTSMCAAMSLAGRTASEWIAQHPNSFPPIVLNLTDGEPTDGDAAVWARRLRSLATSDGPLLLFTITLSSQLASSCLFPASDAGLPDRFTRQMHALSSPLPPGMVESARSSGLEVSAGARGFACNADARAIATFLNVGTSIGRVG